MSYSRHVAEALLDLGSYGWCGCTTLRLCHEHAPKQPTPRANALFRDLRDRFDHGTRADVDRGLDKILNVLVAWPDEITAEEDAMARAEWLQ